MNIIPFIILNYLICMDIQNYIYIESMAYTDIIKGRVYIKKEIYI